MRANKSNKDELNIVLIDPPFGSINGPSIGLPVLVSYLWNHGINIGAIDLSNRFYAFLLTENNIRAGLEHLENQFAQLNRKNRLGFAEVVEFEKLVKLLLKREKLDSELAWLLSCHLDPLSIRNSDNMDLVSFLIQLATIKNFPEIIEFAPRLKKTDLLSKYSSEDIVRATCEESFYTEIFEKILSISLFKMKPVPLVGISVSFSDQVIPAFQCARMIKKKWPDTHITMGGSFVSIHLREINNTRIFDIIDSLVLDEGENPLEKLYGEIDSGSPNLNHIPNLIICPDEKIQHTKKELQPLESLSFSSDYFLFDLDQYLFSPENVIIPFCLSRGCKWKKCSFCRTDIPVFHNYCRPSSDILYEQLVTLVREYGAKTVSFSSAFSEPKVLEYISKRLVEDEIQIHWFASTRLSNDFNRDLCALFRDAGCARLSFGIESFSDRILSSMKKGIQAKQIEQVITDIDGVIPIFLLMMVGIPTETEQEACDGFEKIQDLLSRKLITGYNYNVFHMTYGSDIWKNPRKYHLSNIHWFSENDLFPNVVHFDCPGMSREKAFSLRELFSGNPKEESVKEVKISRKNEPLRYDLRQIRSKIQTARSDYLEVCYGKWLRENEDMELRPITGNERPHSNA